MALVRGPPDALGVVGVDLDLVDRGDDLGLCDEPVDLGRGLTSRAGRAINAVRR